MTFKAALEEIDALKDAADAVEHDREERVDELKKLISASVDRQDEILNNEGGALLSVEEKKHSVLLGQLEELEDMSKWASYEKLKSLSYYI